MSGWRMLQKDIAVDEQQQEEHIEDQDHLEVCRGYNELWEGLGPASPESRIQYFKRVKMKRMKQQQQNK